MKIDIIDEKYCLLCKHNLRCHVFDRSCYVHKCGCRRAVGSLSDYFWYIYMPAHTKPLTKAMHLMGLISTVIFISCIFALNMNLLWLILSPFIVYPWAWSSHYFVEGNKPLAFKNVLLAKLSDIIMCWKLLTFQMKWTESGRY